MRSICEKAAVILNDSQRGSLDKAGLVIIPRTILERLQQCKGEEIIIIEGRPVVIYPAGVHDIERINLNVFI